MRKEGTRFTITKDASTRYDTRLYSSRQLKVHGVKVKVHKDRSGSGHRIIHAHLLRRFTERNQVHIMTHIRWSRAVLSPHYEMRVDCQNRLLPIASAVSSKLYRSPDHQRAARVGKATYQEPTLHSSSDCVWDPASPICSRSDSDTDHEQHTSRYLDSHCPQAECTDKASMVCLVDLRSVLEDSKDSPGNT